MRTPNLAVETAELGSGRVPLPLGSIFLAPQRGPTCAC